MFLRTLLFGLSGAIAGAIILPTVLWFMGQPSFEENYWHWAVVGAAGFVGLAAANLVNEYFGVYEVNLLRRLFRRSPK
jgi:uncharacterized membrane protein YeaQ/YmgE (transglycosylase-associated protein family)